MFSLSKIEEAGVSPNLGADALAGAMATLPTSARGRDLQPIRISTFRSFSVQVHGKPLCSSRKSQQRPLALLKVLIAKGGQDVSCSQLCESLWTDSDGDLGARNLTITLHRLRNLLGAKASLTHYDGKLSLNAFLCWVDVWQFEALADEALREPVTTSGSDVWEARLRTALSLYPGHFLALEAEESWMIEPRIRWKSRFERIVAILTTHLEGRNRFDEAIDLCLQALEIDPLNELLYRRLMSCYLKRNEIAAVIRIYANCRDALMKGLGTQPSMETDRLYRSALEQGSSFRPQPAHRLSGSLA